MTFAEHFLLCAISAFAGFTSGLLGGSIGAYGPPVIVYALGMTWEVRRTGAP